MPYISTDDRHSLDWGGACKNAGQLNYAITKEIISFLFRNGLPKYQDYNDAIGVLECAKMELYRRSVAPYEDKKIQENGDVY